MRPMGPGGGVRRVRVVVSGRVQGVGFRWWVHGAAREAGLAGWVRNRPDGDVEAELEGDGAVVDVMVEALREGPPMARVTGVRTSEVPPRGDREFRIEG